MQGVIWDVDSGRPYVIPDKNGRELEVQEICFSPTGRYLAAAKSSGIQVFDMANGWSFRDFSGRVAPSICFDKSERHLASGLSLWDAASGDRLMSTELPRFKKYSKVLFSPDGTKVYGIEQRERRNSVVVWNLENATTSFPFAFHRANERGGAFNNTPTHDMALAPSGRGLATACHDRRIRIWDTKTHALLMTLVGHDAQVDSIAISPNEKVLVSAGADGLTKLWNVSKLMSDEKDGASLSTDRASGE